MFQDEQDMDSISVEGEESLWQSQQIIKMCSWLIDERFTQFWTNPGHAASDYLACGRRIRASLPQIISSANSLYARDLYLQGESIRIATDMAHCNL